MMRPSVLALCLIVACSAPASMLAADTAPATAPSPAEYRAKFGANLVLLKATYGVTGKTIDVTEQLQGQIKENMLLWQVGDAWGDPASGAWKVLEASYWDGASIKTATVKQGEWVRLLAASKMNTALAWLDKFAPNGETVSEKTAEGIKLTSKDKKGLAVIETADPVKAPLIITAVARTDSNNIRLFFGDRGQVILNWEVNNSELRHHDPKSGEQTGVANKGSVRKNEFATIRWMLDADKSRVEVDGQERAVFRGDYSGVVGKLRIGTTESSVLTVKSIQLTFLPERVGPAAAASVSGLPTVKEINDLMDAGKYQQALPLLARLIELKGPAAANVDHHQLLMMRAECLLQLKQTQSCMQTLAAAAREASNREQAYEAMAMAYLIQKSPKGTYLSDRADKAAWLDMMDRTKRKEAYKALWEDEQFKLAGLLKKVTQAAALPPIMDAARPLGTARAVEYVATKSTKDCDKVTNALRDRAVGLLDGLLKNLSVQTDNLTNIANSKIITHFTDGTTEERRRGLTQAQVDELKEVEGTCKQAINALEELVQIFPDVKQFRELGNKAIEIGQKAEHTRTTLY